jgi:hypothetical protein
MFHQQNKTGEKTMKRVTVIAIAVLFSLVGFKYANAQIPNMAGPLTALSFDVTYQEEVPATSKLSQGRKLVTVVPGIEGKVSGKFKYEPVLYFYFDTNGNQTYINISWLSPKTGNRIVTVSCGSGNIFAPIPEEGLGSVSDAEDGSIGTKPQVSLSKIPPTETITYENIAGCWFCPDGFQPLNSSGQPTGLCNGGESYVSGIMTLQGSAIGDITSIDSNGKVHSTPVSITLKGTFGGSGFYYNGEDDWASPDCSAGTGGSCRARFTGTFGATLKPCSSTDPNCLTVE